MKSGAFVFDLDGIINHGENSPGALEIAGTVKSSFVTPRTLSLLLKISTKMKLFVNTGRSQSYMQDFARHFREYAIPVTGWILEHGAVVSGRPDWTLHVLQDLDLEKIHEQISAIVHQQSLPVDLALYRNSHKGFLLYSVSGKLVREKFVAAIQPVLKNCLRVIVGERKIALIPKKTDKFSAFQQNFGQEYSMTFAAGDSGADLPLLQHARFPLTIADAPANVKDCVLAKGGFVATRISHAGTAELLEVIIRQLES